MDEKVLFFFRDHLEALPLYEAFEARVLAELPETTIRVQKTQISFANKHNFAFVSFLPARRAKDRPPVFITVTFGLRRRENSPRIDAASEPYPNRWTHHVLVSAAGEIDGELLEWLRESWQFSESKRGGRQ